MPSKGIPVQRFRMSDELWARFEPLLPRPRRVAKWRGGRPRLDQRLVADAIFFVLRTGCQWNALSTETQGCSGSSAHRYFQQWVRRDVFRRFWQAGLGEYDEVSGIEWDYQSMDGVMTKAPLGGALQGRIQPIGPRVARRDRSRPTELASRLA
jgi:transposase